MTHWISVRFEDMADLFKGLFFLFVAIIEFFVAIWPLWVSIAAIVYIFK